MEFKTVRVQIPEAANIILGQTHFIKTAEDLYEILAGASPHIKFGVAFTDPLEVVVGETEQGRGIMGVIDGSSPKGVEKDSDKAARKALLRSFGYKVK